MLLFLSLHVGRYSDEKSVKEKWDFGTSWNWFKMKVLIMLSPSVEVHIWKYSSLQETWEKQSKTTRKCALFWIWDNLHHLGRSLSFSEAADYPATFTKISIPPQVLLCFIIKLMVPNSKKPLGNFIIRFSGSEFSQDCSGHYSVKLYVWEKVLLLSYGSKSY